MDEEEAVPVTGKVYGEIEGENGSKNGLTENEDDPPP